MIDNDIIEFELEKLMRSLTKLEFSSTQSDRVVEAARKAREALEELMEVL